MTNFRFKYPIQIRYADLDAQWHVNNARFLTLIEQARLAYLLELGMWDGKSFLDLGIIIADIHIAYLAPIELTQKIEIGVRISKIGNKSLSFDNEVFLLPDKKVLVRCEVVAVAYDFHSHETVPVPEHWRKIITDFENL